MNADFYVNTAPIDKVDKRGSLTVLTTKNNLNVLEPFNVHDGHLVLAYDDDYMDCNYVKIDDIYYFVETPILRIGQRVVMQLTKDVLMTNLSEIMELDVIVDRSSTEYNSYIYDGRQKGQVNYTTFSMGFGDAFSYNTQIIVCAIGGGEIIE